MSKKTSILVGGAGVVVLLVALFAMQYSNLLGARYAPGLEFKVLGPDYLISGEPAVITWDTSPEIRKSYPNEKIEFCKDYNTSSCTVLSPETPNDGKAQVFVPSSMKEQVGFLRLTARTSNGVVGNRSFVRPINIKYGTTLQPNSIAVISWNKNDDYPNVSVDFCAAENDKCYPLVKNAPNNGMAKLTVPSDMPAITGFVRVLAKQDNGDIIYTESQYGKLPVDLGAVLLKPTQEEAGGN